MTKLIDIRMDNYINHIKKGVPVTLGFTLETDGAPPPVGSRLQFRAYGATLLHASMPTTGARMIHSEHSGFSTLAITDDQRQGWNPTRTLTFKTEQNLEPSKIAELFGIVYYQPSHEENMYCSVLVKGNEEQAISTRQVFKTKWQDQATQGYIYSYDVIVKSNGHSFARWKFSSAGLPVGTKIYANPWLDVAHDGTEGVIELVTPPGDQYLLEPGKELAVSIQLLYPAASGQSPAFECLPNLMAFPR
jgi:hypothetical protein